MLHSGTRSIRRFIDVYILARRSASQTGCAHTSGARIRKKRPLDLARKQDLDAI
jgi:hypothetical protein